MADEKSLQDYTKEIVSLSLEQVLKGLEEALGGQAEVPAPSGVRQVSE
jgi:hypothetical protein